MQMEVITIINGRVVDEVNCTAYNEEGLINEKLRHFNIPVLQSAGVDAGVYIKRESRMNRPGFEEDAIEDVGRVDLLK